MQVLLVRKDEFQPCSCGNHIGHFEIIKTTKSLLRFKGDSKNPVAKQELADFRSAL